MEPPQNARAHTKPLRQPRSRVKVNVNGERERGERPGRSGASMCGANCRLAYIVYAASRSASVSLRSSFLSLPLSPRNIWIPELPVPPDAALYPAGAGSGAEEAGVPWIRLGRCGLRRRHGRRAARKESHKHKVRVKPSSQYDAGASVMYGA